MEDVCILLTIKVSVNLTDLPGMYWVNSVCMYKAGAHKHSDAYKLLMCKLRQLQEISKA